MKRRAINVFSVILVLCFVVTSFVFAQDKDKYESKATKDERTTYTEDKRPEENYLAKFRARDVVEKLMKENIEKIYMLKVIVSNFPDKEWVKEYDDIYEGYKKEWPFFIKGI